MFILFITLTILAALFLVLVVLAQNPKGGGLSGTFGGSGGQLIGVKKTTDIMEKLTWGLAIAVLLFSLMSSFLLKDTRETEGLTSPNLEKAGEKTVLPNMGSGVPGATDTLGDQDLERLEDLPETE